MAVHGIVLYCMVCTQTGGGNGFAFTQFINSSLLLLLDYCYDSCPIS